MAFVRLRGPRVQELKSSGGVVYSVQSSLPEAGGQSPGRVLGVTPWGLLPTWRFPLHVNSCCDRVGTAFRRVDSLSARHKKKLHVGSVFLENPTFIDFVGV